MVIAKALFRLLTATAVPSMLWLPLNVVMVDNDRGASLNSYRACVLGAGTQEVPPVTAGTHATVAAIARDLLLSESARGGMTRC